MREESKELQYMLVASDVVSSENQEEVPGLIFVAHIMPEVTTLRFRQDHTNIFTSVVLELGQVVDIEK